MTGIDEQAAPAGKRNWKKISLIAGGVFLALVVIGGLAGSPEESTVTLEQAADEQVATTKAPTTTEAPTTTTEAQTTTTTTTAAPITTTPPTTAPPATAPPTTADPYASESVSQGNARQKADSYLDMMAFSRSGLIEQLEFEGFPTGDATYGVDAQHADWNEQAAKKAASYLEMMSFSRSGLVEQLVFEGFTPAEAEYGVSTTGL